MVLPFPFTLDPHAGARPNADLVFVGNPANPTSVAPRGVLLSLVQPGRTVVVEEAFADCLPGERESLADEADLTGLLVIRSLKTWGLAGLRVGYLLAAPDIVRLLAAAPAAVAGLDPALTACLATASDAAASEAGAWAVGDRCGAGAPDERTCQHQGSAGRPRPVGVVRGLDPRRRTGHPDLRQVRRGPA